MAWETLPIVSAVRLAHWNELIAAANERNAVSLKAAALPQIDGRVPRASQVMALRQRVEALIPYFCDWDTGAVWTKVACLQAAIGEDDWTTPTVTHRTAIRAPHVDDLKKVLDLLFAFKVAEAGGWAGQFRFPAYGYGASWDAAWIDGKSAYAASHWGSGSIVASAGISNLANNPTPGAYMQSLRHYRAYDAAFNVPAGLPSVTGARVGFTSSGAVASPIGFLWYDQKNFGGASTPFTWSGAACPAVDIAAPGTGLVERSFCTATDLFSGAEMDTYRPPDVDYATEGFLIEMPVMMLKLDFQYLEP